MARIMTGAAPQLVGYYNRIYRPRERERERCIYTYVYKHTPIKMNLHIYIYIYIYVHMHAYIHIYIYTLGLNQYPYSVGVYFRHVILYRRIRNMDPSTAVFNNPDTNRSIHSQRYHEISTRCCVHRPRPLARTSCML